ncbi:MAG: aquaporin, partial [Hyphomicrobiales bacterium]
MIKALVAEALGTFSWVGAVCAAMLVTGEGNFSVSAIIATALCAGFTIAAMTAALRALSSCHFNPAVSLAAVIAGQLGPGRAAGYVLAQVFGGALAALFVFLA